jgi:hypothetical protein
MTPLVTATLIVEVLVFMFLNVVQTIALVSWITLYMQNELHLRTWKNWFYTWLGTLVAMFLLVFFVYYELLWASKKSSIEKNRDTIISSDDEYV